MTQEEKDLLLKDLSARLPYKVKVEHTYIPENNGYTCEMSGHTILLIPDNEWLVKPYLRPMSSITEEEQRELSRLLNDDKLLTCDLAKTFCLYCGIVIDFHNSHHLDWRGLIEKGLALEAPDGMYKTYEINPQ